MLLTLRYMWISNVTLFIVFLQRKENPANGILKFVVTIPKAVSMWREKPGQGFCCTLGAPRGKEFYNAQPVQLSCARF